MCGFFRNEVLLSSYAWQSRAMVTACRTVSAFGICWSNRLQRDIPCLVLRGVFNGPCLLRVALSTKMAHLCPSTFVLRFHFELADRQRLPQTSSVLGNLPLPSYLPSFPPHPQSFHITRTLLLSSVETYDLKTQVKTIIRGDRKGYVIEGSFHF